jgi:hypothetical protein
MAEPKRNAVVLLAAAVDKTRASLVQNPRPRQKGARLRPTADTHSLEFAANRSAATTKDDEAERESWGRTLASQSSSPGRRSPRPKLNAEGSERGGHEPSASQRLRSRREKKPRLEADRRGEAIKTTVQHPHALPRKKGGWRRRRIWVSSLVG